MNHDPIAPALNDPPLRSSDELSARHNHVDYSGNTADIEHTSQHSEDADATDGTNILYDRTTSSAVPAAIKPWGERFAAKRKAALDTLFNTLDSLVYLELVVLYCFDISSTLLLLRLITHLSPLPSTLALLPARLRPSIKNTTLFPIILVNLVAMIYHLAFKVPEAGEATRFDLHGHIIVDFVGQRVLTEWAGRVRLVGLDVLVLGLQCVGCGVLAFGEKREGVGAKDLGASISISAGEGVSGGGAAEGNGSRSQRTEESDEGIEMQPLMRSIGTLEDGPRPRATLNLEAQNDGNADDEDAEQLSSADADTLARNGLEALYSGQALLVDICFWTLLRDQYYERRNRALAGRV